MAAKINNALELIQMEIAKKRSSLQNLDSKLFPLDTEKHPKPRSLIEISGNDGSGKTHILKYLIARVLTPEEFDGKHCRVIFLDLKHKFNAEYLRKQIEMLLQSPTSPLSAQECAEISLNCLKAVIVINCFESKEFAMALDDVENILMEDENGEIGLLAIDGLNVFYWEDINEKIKRMNTHYIQITDRIRCICATNNICCAYTVDSRYLEAKVSNQDIIGSMEYTLTLSSNPTTGKYLNNFGFVITDKGVIFS